MITWHMSPASPRRLTFVYILVGWLVERSSWGSHPPGACEACGARHLVRREKASNEVPPKDVQRLRSRVGAGSGVIGLDIMLAKHWG